MTVRRALRYAYWWFRVALGILFLNGEAWRKYIAKLGDERHHPDR